MPAAMPIHVPNFRGFDEGFGGIGGATGGAAGGAAGGAGGAAERSFVSGVDIAAKCLVKSEVSGVGGAGVRTAGIGTAGGVARLAEVGTSAHWTGIEGTSVSESLGSIVVASKPALAPPGVGGGAGRLRSLLGAETKRFSMAISAV